MQSTTTYTAATTYTTIPISGGDVISRSIQNLSNFVSLQRPWSELIASGVFDAPKSLSDAGIRLRMNAKYFGINYAIVIAISAAAILIGTPIAWIVYAAVFALWLVLYFFREDPMVAWGRHVDDRIVIVGLILVSVIAVWLTGSVNTLWIGISVGVLISAVHGMFRNPQGLFLDENDAVSDGLIRSPSSASSSHTKDFPI
ncbi:PRA1 family protein, partial [Actinidia chinensis var. chinensis]